ncbi:unnamed protein product [Linum trigynum]|uniref:Uncharacterized protein n=1 Tax=Linum trigynum TaxID=586398 RepID=A0AAV2EPJ0_9ROSI
MRSDCSASVYHTQRLSAPLDSGMVIDAASNLAVVDETSNGNSTQTETSPLPGHYHIFLLLRLRTTTAMDETTRKTDRNRAKSRGDGDDRRMRWGKQSGAAAMAVWGWSVGMVI